MSRPAERAVDEGHARTLAAVLVLGGAGAAAAAALAAAGTIDVSVYGGILIAAGFASVGAAWWHVRFAIARLAAEAWMRSAVDPRLAGRMREPEEPGQGGGLERLSALRAAAGDALRGALAELRSEEARAERWRRVLETYLGAETLGEVLRARIDGRPAAGVVPQDAVLVYADLRGFTAMSDQLPPEAVVRILSEYYVALTEAVESSGGRVRQFVGDAVMATFDWPRRRPEAIRRAVICALEMQVRFRTLAAAWGEGVSAPLELGLGVGVHGGTVRIGNLGSAGRMQFGVVGAPMATVARLTAIASPGEVLVSSELVETHARAYRVTTERLLTLPGGMRLLRAFAVDAVF